MIGRVILAARYAPLLREWVTPLSPLYVSRFFLQGSDDHLVARGRCDKLRGLSSPTPIRHEWKIVGDNKVGGRGKDVGVFHDGWRRRRDGK